MGLGGVGGLVTESCMLGHKNGAMGIPGASIIIITERFSEVNCFRRIGESDREAHALNRIFWPICRFFVRKLQVGDKVKWQ